MTPVEIFMLGWTEHQKRHEDFPAATLLLEPPTDGEIRQIIRDQPVDPPLSEIFEAMARGVMVPYQPSQNIRNGGITPLGFDSRSYDRAKEQSAMFSAIAAVYRKYQGD